MNFDDFWCFFNPARKKQGYRSLFFPPSRSQPSDLSGPRLSEWAASCRWDPVRSPRWQKPWRNAGTLLMVHEGLDEPHGFSWLAIWLVWVRWTNPMFFDETLWRNSTERVRQSLGYGVEKASHPLLTRLVQGLCFGIVKRIRYSLW